jgi:hypothetical protein
MDFWKELTRYGYVKDVAPMNVPVLVQTPPNFTYIKPNTAVGEAGWKRRSVDKLKSAFVKTVISDYLLYSMRKEG